MTASRVLMLATVPIVFAATHSAFAPCDRALRRLEGYTVVKASSLKGTFNGCDYDRLIELVDGTVLRCASYGYQYAYAPDAVLFGQGVTIDGKTITISKLLVEGELYDVTSK